MSRETFRVLCNQLKPMIEWKTTKLRESISVEKRLAITLWFLATTAEYHTIAHLFGVARSSVCEIVWETTAAIVHCLLSTYINFPVGESLKSVVDGFLLNGVYLSVQELLTVLILLLNHIFLIILTITTAKVGIQFFSRLSFIITTCFETFVSAGLAAFMMQGFMLIQSCIKMQFKVKY